MAFTTTSVFGQVPSANFTATPLSGCSPIVVNFTDQSTNNPTAWAWNFGNGSTSSLQNPTATYFTPGTYTVTLTATNASGSNTITRTNYITVYSQPVVNFTADDSTGCFPVPVQFTSLSNGGPGNTITSYEWDFGDGSTSTFQNPAHTYITSGNFTVTLKVTNDKGCVRIFSKPQYIRVTPGVVADFTNSQPTFCAPPIPINFNSTSTGPGNLTYAWNFGDGGTDNVQNPSHVYNSPGTFVVTLTVTSDQGCSATIVQDTAVIIDTIITAYDGPDSICIGQVAYFTNTSSPSSLTSFWDFGDGSNSSATNPSKLYAAPGTYQVKLRSLFPSGCIDSVIRPLVVLPKATANFTSPDSVKCQPPHTVPFQDLSTGGAVSWEWDFGDGGTSTLQNPSHTYTALGTYDVTLIVTNAVGCKDTLVKPDFVQITRPIINFAGLPAEGCVPYTIAPVPVITTFDNVTSYLWDFGDGNTSTLQNPTNTYTVQGTYTVTLTITTSGGCTETRVLSGAVRVGTRPTVDFFANPLVSCAKQPIQFTDQSVPADQWIWHFGDGGTSFQQNPIHNYIDTGYFTVKLIAINNGCRDSLTRPLYIQILPPVARFNTLMNCSARNTFTFSDQSVLPVTWSWDFGDGNTSNVQNPPPHTYGALGVYNVILTVTNGSCTDTTMQIIRVINENPNFNADRISICHRESVTFTAANIIATNVTNYEWDFGDGAQTTTTTGSVSHSYANSGSYSVRLITIDLNGCRDTIDKVNYIRVNGPLASFTGNTTAGCTGFTATFTDMSTTDGVNAITSWKWDFGDGQVQTFTAPPFTHVYNTVGTFHVKLIVTDAAGCVDSVTVFNLINASNPFVTFNTTTQLTCPGADVFFSPTAFPNIVSAVWDFGDGTFANTLVPPLKQYTANGVYTVKLVVTDNIGCSDSLIRPNYVTVNSPIADYIRDDTASTCIPFEVNFTNQSTFFTTSLWDFNDGGTSSLTNPTHYFTTPGVFNVELLITSPGGCKDSITRTITVYDTAGTRLNYAPLGGCIPQTVNFNVSTPSPATFIWDFGDGQSVTTTSPNVTYTYTTFGSYVPKVILEDPSGCVIPVPGFDTVNVVGATAKFGISDSLFCDTGFVLFTDSTEFNDPIVSYSWNFGDGGTSNLQNPTHTYVGAGFYNVYLAIQTQQGCRDTLWKDSLMKIVARPDIRIDSDPEACVFEQLNVTGAFNVPDTSIVTWQWTFGNGNSSIDMDPPNQTYTSSGNYTITAVATNSTGCRDTISRDIRIHPLPSVTMPPEITIIAGTSASLPAVYSGNMNSYLWTPPIALDCPTCPAPITSTPRDQVYRTTFIDSNGCENTGSILVRVICKGSNVFVPNTFSPNGDGNNEVFYPRGTGLNRARVMRIFNRWGEVIFERYDFPVNNAASGWDGTSKGQKVSAGVYVYQLEIYCENGELLKFNGNISLLR